jgi:hypothetical protein
MGANGSAGNDQAVAGVKDAEFGCRSRCHIIIGAVRGALTGYRSEAYGTNYRSQGFKSGGCSFRLAHYIHVVEVCDELRGGVSWGCALQGALERKGENKGSKGVPLLNAARGGDGG